ncbi:MAG: hypothetical protein QOH04_3245 [Sphingomonadales bacterium]|jgi:hypothetical protein|nr:hypothetical protein [Sphingomonadales bacterium]MEA3037443.1 hypothetical protein [Sphingomonadales bacterium]
MRWNKRPKVERPEYPKLVPIAATKQEVRDLLPLLLESDPDAEVVEGGARGIYARVHNEAAETAAKRYGESRNFPLS